MIGFLIAMISGLLMSVQGVFNTQVTNATHIWVSGIIVQATALVTTVFMWYITGRHSFAGIAKLENKYVLLGGVIGAFITYTVIRSITMLGVAKANLMIVITQLIAAYIIEVFGMFGSEKCQFNIVKIIGLVVAVAGVVIFCLAGAKEG